MFLAPFLFITLVYTLFFYPVISTGDGGGLATASQTLGIAHPPGYPLYLEVNKLLSFLPVGNISERMIFGSVLFSILSLFLLFKIVKALTESSTVALFGVVYVAFTYSFMGQSVVLKFYPLNLFLITFLLYMGVLASLKGYKKEYIYTSALILGLSSGNHHTALFMLVPLALLFLSFGKRAVVDGLKSIPLFLLGFTVNLHAIVRSYSESAFLFMPTKDLSSFIYMFLRKPYGKASSLEAVESGFGFLEGYVIAIKNLTFILVKNFTFAGVFLFLFGLFLLFKKSKRAFTFILTSFFMFGIFLAKITLARKELDAGHLYIVAHQYYIPAFLLFALLCSLPLAVVYEFFKKKNMELAYRVVPLVVLTFPLLFLFDRALDQNFSRNYVPYSYMKTTLTTMPGYSFFITRGDNAIFLSWYLKSLMGFRNDICNVEIPPEENSIYLRGCQPSDLYKATHKEFFGGDLLDLARDNRLFSSGHIDKSIFLSDALSSKFYLVYYKLVPKGEEDKHKRWIEDNFLYFQKFMFTPYRDCISHKSDDYFTVNLCKFVSYNFAMAAKILEKKTLFTLSNPNEEIDTFMNMYFQIAQHNDLSKNFYYIEGEKKHDER